MPDNFSLLIAGSWLYYTVLALLFGVTAFLYYRITIPVVSPVKRYFLLALRVIILLLMALLLFSPVATLLFTSEEKPVNYFLIDRSESITFKDGTDREKTVKQFLADLASSPLAKNSKVITFSSQPDSTKFQFSDSLRFDGELTNFEEIFDYFHDRKIKNATLTIVSDGVITDGNIPGVTAEKIGLPVYTVAIGDSTPRKDIVVDNVVFNEVVYLGTSSPVTATIQIAGFADKDIAVSLLEDGRKIGEETVSIGENGTVSSTFNYRPRTTGIKKLAISVQQFPDEVNKLNNYSPFYVSVVENKRKILILSGAPTPDVTFVKNALVGDSTITVRSMTYDSDSRPLEKDINESVLDSAGVLFLLNFPSQAVPQKMLDEVINLISNRNVPFFIMINQYSDKTLLKKLEPYLPVILNAGAGVEFEGQPAIAEGVERNPLFYSTSPGALKAWDDLPPVLIPNLKAEARPESQVLVFVKLNSRVMPNPLIVSRNFGSKRSLAVIAGDIWKWKLKAKNENLFDDFLFSTAKWLGAVKDKKRFSLRTNKKFYSRNEQVDFIAELYTESFDPLSDGEVAVTLNSPQGKTNFNLSSIGSGIYQGIYKPESSGDYTFSGVATLDGKAIATDGGNFNTGDINIEMLNPYTNTGFLRNLSSITRGEFYYNNNYLKLFDDLTQFNKESALEIKTTETHNLWNNPWLLLIIVLLLSLEWFFRKREGMM